MNEITRIHLARTPYEIDIEAKKALERYVRAIKESLADDVAIYDDIEIRMTEILADRGVHANSIITPGDIDAIKSQLGEPSDFASNQTTGDKDGERGQDNVFTRGKDDRESAASKRYYRDEENGILGGVIAGLAAYTGWDVTLLRVLFVILTIVPSFGTMIIVYIAVWIIAPAAKTTGEKLEMRGEPVNLESIKESAKKFGEKAEAVGRDVSERAKVWQQTAGPKVAEAGRNSSRAVLRVLMLIAGLILLFTTLGLLASGGIASALLLIATVASVNQPALIVALSLATLAGLLFVIGLLILSIALMSQKFSHRAKVGCLTTFIISVFVAIAAVGVGIGWVTGVGTVRAGETINTVDQSLQDNLGGIAPQIRWWW